MQRRWLIATGLTFVVLAPVAHAQAPINAQYRVGKCWADKLNYNDRAFETFATRGMEIVHACNPTGRGERGLITRNAKREVVEIGAKSEIKLNAPAGTEFTHINWAGGVKRRDCRYALQFWAENIRGEKVAWIENTRANYKCRKAPTRRPLIGPAITTGYPTERHDLPGATRLVQRTLCVGRRGRPCSGKRRTFMVTTHAEVTIRDTVPPTASIVADTPLARGQWVGGLQPLNYTAADNVGVLAVEAFGGSRSVGRHPRPCSFADPESVFADLQPCPNGPGQIGVNTRRLSDGMQRLLVRAQDPAALTGNSGPVDVRIDNTPPGRADVRVDGGESWRNQNAFAVSWTNVSERDRAPIAAVAYQLCGPRSGGCTRASEERAHISRLAVRVPGPGEWTLSLWRRDAAGNETDAAASVPVNLRYDPEPPRLAFEPPSPEDPTLVSVPVTDAVSGLAHGAIEISSSGSGVWQAIPTERAGERLTARIDDATLPAGSYQLRARAFDQAGNEASTDRRGDGELMTLTLPLRIVATMRGGFERARVVRRTVRRGGKRRVVRRRERTLERVVRIRHGRRARIAGRLVNRDGDGIPGAEIRVLSSSATTAEQAVATVQTDSEGRWRYSAEAGSSRTLRFVYSGSPLVLPATLAVQMLVPGRTSLRVSRRRVLNGQAVTFRGQLRSRPAPPGGKLVELQARLSDRWQTFRTARTNDAGRWSVRYRFKRTRGVQRFRFRARLPQEAAYPFAAGRSKPVTVRVRGLT